MSQELTKQVHEDAGEIHDHDRGLSFDLSTLMSRRRALQLLAVGGLTTLVGCGASSGNSPGTTASTAAATTTGSTGGTTTASGTTSEIPEETSGPYPADGSNGVNVLGQSGIVRRDITTSFGSASRTAEGVPLAIELTILDVSAGGTPLEGAAVYLWHCDRDGNYSLYSSGLTGENYLRGVQASDANGKVSFASIFPAAYSGRWPHIHFEVYPSLAEATAAGTKMVTSQIALPEDACKLVYATSGYEQSVNNLAQSSLETDNVFSDGFSTQLVTATGSPSQQGMAITLNVGV
jgi:protocatechuate 3,4-dioxygenase beta subunit